MARSKADQILQLKVTLAEVEPPVWRRLLVPADMTLAKLHDALQDAVGWTNSHPHCFEIAGRRIGMVGVEEDSPELEDERRVRVAGVLPRKGTRLVYRYDYGDDWEHMVEVEDVTSPDRRLSYPVCLPRRKEEYQPKVKGKAVGPPVAIEVPCLPTRWRWYHASVYRRLTVLEGKKDAYGRFTEKPEIALAYDPDAILALNARDQSR